MGKTAKSITALSSKAKQKKKELQKAQLQRPVKKVITKEKDQRTPEALKAQRKADLRELKMLLKLDADSYVNPSLLSNEEAAPGQTNTSSMSMDTDIIRKRKPS